MSTGTSTGQVLTAHREDWRIRSRHILQLLSARMDPQSIVAGSTHTIAVNDRSHNDRLPDKWRGDPPAPSPKRPRKKSSLTRRIPGRGTNWARCGGRNLSTSPMPAITAQNQEVQRDPNWGGQRSLELVPNSPDHGVSRLVRGYTRPPERSRGSGRLKYWRAADYRRELVLDLREFAPRRRVRIQHRRWKVVNVCY